MTRGEYLLILHAARANALYWENECTALEDELQEALENCQQAYKELDYILEADND